MFEYVELIFPWHQCVILMGEFKLKLYKVNWATKGDQCRCKPDRFLKRIWIDYPRFFLNKYMDGRKNVSISHILPGGRYASAVHSWISTLTAGVWSRYIFSFCLFFCLFFLQYFSVTLSVSVSACGSVITIDSSSELSPQLCNPMWPGLSVIRDGQIVTGQWEDIRDSGDQWKGRDGYIAAHPWPWALDTDKSGHQINWITHWDSDQMDRSDGDGHGNRPKMNHIPQ